jgi:hypothetical protein
MQAPLTVIAGLDPAISCRGSRLAHDGLSAGLY